MKRIAFAALTLVPLVILTACGGDDDDDSGGADAPAATSTFGLPPQGGGAFDLDPTTLTTTIDNEFWPMEPGTRWTYTETDSDGNETQVIVTVTTETKQIANGATARVVRDTNLEDGEVIEDTFDWFAQDADGNIWYLGEDTAEIDGSDVSKEGSWEAGVDGALPGVALPADPVVGMKYRQEYYAGEAEDNGEVLATDATADVPAGSYTGCLQTKDTSGSEPNALENKFYAPGVGPVLTTNPNGGGREELTRVETVSDAIAKAAGTTPLGEPYD